MPGWPILGHGPAELSPSLPLLPSVPVTASFADAYARIQIRSLQNRFSLQRRRAALLGAFPHRSAPATTVAAHSPPSTSLPNLPRRRSTMWVTALLLPGLIDALRVLDRVGPSPLKNTRLVYVPEEEGLDGLPEWLRRNICAAEDAPSTQTSEGRAQSESAAVGRGQWYVLRLPRAFGLLHARWRHARRCGRGRECERWATRLRDGLARAVAGANTGQLSRRRMYPLSAPPPLAAAAPLHAHITENNPRKYT